MKNTSISILSAHYYKLYIVIYVEHSNMAKGFHASVARPARNIQYTMKTSEESKAMATHTPQCTKNNITT
jgi:hypothetical protein